MENNKAEHITAIEIMRRRNGPWTEEEKTYYEKQTKDFNDAINEMFFDPLVNYMIEVMLREGMIKNHEQNK
jgi:hypothetical protein